MSTMLLLSLLAATDQSLQPIDPFDDVAAWSVNEDGSQGLTFRAEPGGALHLTFDASGQNLWGNLRRTVTVPPNAVALRFRLKVLGASAEAGMHVWFMEADGDGYVVRVKRDEQDVLAAPKGEWREVTVPLGTLNFEPRGNGKRAFLTVNRVLLGLNYAPAEVLVDDLAWVVGPGRAGAPLPASAAFQPVDGARGTVAILDEPAAPRSPGAVDVARLAEALTAAGYGVTRVRAGDIADPQRLTPANFDLLVLPAAPSFPAAARDGLLGYLRAKGAVLSVGGYAFDRPLLWNGTDWADIGSDTQAADLDKGVPDVVINSRRGKPGDTMGLDAAQVGLFDPQDTFTDVSYAELGGKRIDGPLEGFVARSLAGSNSPVFPDQHGETETFGQAYDRLGRPRGALGVVCHLYAGPYAGAAWGGFAVSNRDLFAADAAGIAPLLEVVDRLVSGVYLRHVTADKPCVRAGETVRVQCQAANRSTRPRTVRIVLKVDGEPVAPSNPATIAPGGEETLAAELPLTNWDRDFYPVTAELYDGDRLLMTRETAFCAWQPGVIARGHKPVWRGNYFEVNGRPAFLTGTNQTGVMWYSPREDPLTWDRDFQQMEDHGFFVWRVLHFSPFADPDGKPQNQRGVLLLANRPPDTTIRKMDAIVQLAQKHGVVIFLTAHDWMGCSLTDDELDAQRTWNRFWADRYRDVPGLIWDIQNEPSVEMGSAALYAQYLTAAYGTLGAARTALGYRADEPPTPQPGDGSWGDVRGAAVERFRTWLLQRWVAANAAGLKEGNPDSIFTVGYLQDRHSADKVNGAKGLTFANMHCYESSQSFVASFRWVDHRAYGQGLSLGEFGSVASHNHRVNGGTGLVVDQDRRHFTTTIGMTFGVGGAFACNWFWRDMPDVVFPWGLFRQDRVPRPWVADMEALTLAT
ncbi:MAG: cellulase family glycosylhydrolase, partial [Armatimonadetes bacterium]|nr:cellulase family glycosylhydrolase [Armatimonadota bacterium]